MSPVVATLLMISITVTLAGSVYLIADHYSSMTGDKPEIFVVDVEIDSDGVIEVDGEGTPTGHTYSSIGITSTHRNIEWKNYKVIVEGEKVFTVPELELTPSQIPDASDDIGPRNTGKTIPGITQYFTEDGYRDDFRPLLRGESYNVVIVNIDEDWVVWMGDVTAE